VSDTERIAQPRTMSASREATLRPMPSHLMGPQQLSEVFAELDAERAAFAQLEAEVTNLRRDLAEGNRQNALILVEYKAAGNRVRELEEELNNTTDDRLTLALNQVRELEAQLARAYRERDDSMAKLASDKNRAIESRDRALSELAELRKRIITKFGGMGPGSTIWGNTQWDKGYCAAITVVLAEFDAARAAIPQPADTKEQA